VVNVCRVQLKCDDTRWRTGGEVKGKLVNGVCSQYPSYPVLLPLMRTPRLPVVDNWRPHRFKWTHPFRRKKKSGFCACVIAFQTQSTTCSILLTLCVPVSHGSYKKILFACTTFTDRSKYRTRCVLCVVWTPFVYVSFRWTSVFRGLKVMWYVVGIQRRGICMMTVRLQLSRSLILEFQTSHHSELGHTNNSRVRAS